MCRGREGHSATSSLSHSCCWCPPSQPVDPETSSILFIWVELQACESNSLQNPIKRAQGWCKKGAMDQHVIQIYQTPLVGEASQHLVHQPGKGSRCIAPNERTFNCQSPWLVQKKRVFGLALFVRGPHNSHCWGPGMKTSWNQAPGPANHPPQAKCWDTEGHLSIFLLMKGRFQIGL